MARGENGSLVFLFVNKGTDQSPQWVEAGLQDGLEESESIDMIEGNPKGQGSKIYVAGEDTSTLTLNNFWAKDDTALAWLIQAARQKKEVVARIQYGQDPTEPDVISEATFLISGRNASWPRNAAATCSFTLQRTGPWHTVGEGE